MFKSANALITRKYSKYAALESKNSDINRFFRSFLDNQFGSIAKKISCSLVYDHKKNWLTIKADNKIVANELSLRINDLMRTFKEANIKLVRIVIQ